MGLREGMKVADLGVGSGRHALSAARIVGDTGRVYAVDIQESVLIRLKDDMVRLGVKNIEMVWGDLEKAGGTKLKEHSMQAIILSNVLFQIVHKNLLLKEIERICASEAKVLVVDWAGAYGGMGPEKERVVSEQETEKMFIDGGFHKQKSFRGGTHHYAILFTAP